MTKTVTLGEICTLEYGRSLTKDNRRETGPYPVYGSSGIVGFHDKYLTEGPCLIVGRKGSVGALHFSEKSCWPIDTAYYIHKEGLDHKFLFYQLSTLRLNELDKSTSIPGLNRNDAYQKEIILPSLDEQRRIAALLDQADALRQKDRQLLAHYDKLAQSLFLDLFGDPVTNEKGWERVKIRDLVREVKYGTSKPAEDKGAFPYLRMNNITYEGHWNFTDLKYINLTKTEEAKYILQKGDLVFNRTNSKELVGKTAVYQLDEPMAIAGYLIRTRVNEKAKPEYISAYLNSKHGKAILKGMCKNIIGMANINAQELQEIDILQTPLGLQNQFAQMIEKIEQQKAVVRQQMAASEALFGRLLQESFSA